MTVAREGRPPRSDEEGRHGGEGQDGRRGASRRLHGEVRPGRRRRDERRARRDRRPAGSLSGDGRLPAGDAGAARRAHRHEGALRARMAQQPGGERLRGVRPRRRHVPAAAGAGDGARGREQPGVRARRVPDRRGDGQGRGADHRALPDRRRLRLARAPPGSLRRHRAVLPPRLPGEHRPLVASRARRCRGEARGGGARRRHRLWARRVDDRHGPGVPEQHVRRLRLPRGVDRDGPRAPPIARACPTAWRSRSRARPSSAVGRSTSCASTTPCTTWATRSARRPTSSGSWRRTARGWSSSRSPTTRWRTTSTPSGACTTPRPRASARRTR